MSAPADPIANLQAAIAAQESLRPILGDAVVNTTIAALRAQLDALQAAATRAPGALAPEQLLARLLPKELADKMRATGHIEGERKQATVMFADLSGFTALGERIDPEEISAFQNDLFPEMAAAVFEYEGYIDKFIGDAIMAVFGAPIAHEDDPERALRAALEMRARIVQLNRAWAERLGSALSLHVGVNTGVVVAGEISSGMALTYTVTGDTVNTASRLSDAAAPGQILVSRETYRLTQGAFDFVALDPITVKGKRDPLPVFEVQRAKLRPLKSRGIKELGNAFVGREAERAQLSQVLADVLAGQGRIVTVVGEAGLGKSRLMAEWQAEVGERARWREGRAFAHTAGVAYGPFLDFFRRYADIKDDDPETKARAVLDRAVSRLFGNDVEAHALLANLLAMRLSPAESELIATMPAQTIRQKMFELIAQLIEEPSRRRPTVLVLEDMHWGDSTSVELTEYLLSLTERVPLALVIITRPDLDAPSAKLLSTIESRYAERAVRLALSPLSEDSSIQMVEQLLSSHDLPDTLTDLIRGKAEGNPFFVEEVIRMLIERGALVRATSPDGGGTDGAWVATGLINSVTVPNTLQGVLMSRLDRLPAETKWLAQQASVVGRIFLYRVLLRLSDSGDSLDSDLSHLERQELIRERTRHPEVEYIFKHALTQEVAYQSLLAPRRKELHRKVGEVMETLFAERRNELNSIIAFHYLRGEVWDKAAHYSLQAGDAAMGLYAHAEARQHFADALDALGHLPDNDANRRLVVDATTKRTATSWIADKPEDNLARLAKAEMIVKALGEPGGLSPADRIRLARIYYWTGRLKYVQGAAREAIGYYQQVLVLAEDTDDPELLGGPASVIGQALTVQGQFGRAAPLLTQAIALLEKTATLHDLIRTQGFLGVTLAARGHYPQGRAEGEQALKRAEDINNRSAMAALHVYLSFIHILGGDMARAVEQGQAAAQVAEQSGDRVLVYAGAAFEAWAHSRMGQHTAALAAMERSQSVARALGGRLILANWFNAANAEIAFNAGRVDEALTKAEQTATAAKAGGDLFGEGIAQRVWAQALAALDPPRWDESEAHMAASLQTLEAGECQVGAARTQFAWGLLCQQRGERAAALEHTRQAVAGFESAGMSEDLAAARALTETLK